jgi:predicted amidohydrolase/predicted N-acetyltransferase YhbS
MYITNIICNTIYLVKINVIKGFLMAALENSKLVVREANADDVDKIVTLSRKIYKSQAFSKDNIKAQLRYFPKGQFVAVYDDKIVGHCATFRIDERIALAPHTLDSISGYGFASRHDPKGNTLYGMEVCVDESYRGLRIGQRLYNARKKLCQDLKLKAIIFGGRMPRYSKRKDKNMSPEEYVATVIDKKLRDPVVNFQLRNGFESIGILPNYMRNDMDSEGFASHMIWHNPLYPDSNLRKSVPKGRVSDSVRVAAVQLQARKIESFEHFINQLEYFIDIAADYHSDFVLFPELLTIPLLSMESNRLQPQEAMLKITEYTDQFIKSMQNLALSYNINIIGGSHPTLNDNNEINNICYVFLRDGSVHSQGKIHPTPSEKEWWNIKGCNKLQAIDTDCGPIGILICYDSEFPEAARHLADQGALMLFVPFCTDEKQGYQRVRYCSHARAIENQVYVVMAGMVGNLPDVENMDIHYAESSILTPCDFPFSPNGVAASSAPNTEMIVFADLRLDNLLLSRNSGTVTNFNDRRFDLYKVDWKKHYS